MKNILVIVAVFFTIISCDVNQEIIVLNTNDSHGILVANDDIGGLAQRATLIEQERKSNKNILLLDAGDINSGDYSGLTNSSTVHIEAYNHMGYDAMTVGVHDINRMISDIRRQESIASFPFLSANIRFDDKLLFKPYIIKEYNGFKIGIFGVTTCLAPIYQKYAKYIEFENSIVASKRVIKELREKHGVDMVIALTHLGIRGTGKHNTSSIELAYMVDGIDLIIDGHSHTFMNQPLISNNTQIVSAYRDGLYVGRGVISVTNGKYTGFTWKPIAVKNYAPNKELEKIINQHNHDTKGLLLENIGFADASISNKINSQNISQAGVLITDALIFGSRNIMEVPHLAMVRSNISNDELKSGYLNRKDIFDFIKNDSEVVIVSLRGDKLRKLFIEIADRYRTNGTLPHISRNVYFVIDTINNSVEDIRIFGKNIDYSATYNIVTTCDIACEDVMYESILSRQSYFESASSLGAWLARYVEATETVSIRKLTKKRFK